MALTTVKARLLSSLFESLEEMSVLSEAKAGVATAASPPHRTRNRMILHLVTTTSLRNHLSSAPDRPPHSEDDQHDWHKETVNCPMTPS
jgi:hypothetical protein